LLPELTTHDFESVTDEFDEMEHVGAHERLRSMTRSGHRLQKRGSEVHRNRLDHACTLGSEFGEEPVQRLGVFAFCTPHDTGPVVIDDERQILVVFAPGDLVDPDAEQAIESFRVEFAGDNTFTGASDGPPRHPAQAGDRGLVHSCRQPRQQIIEVACQMSARAGERDRFDDDPVGWATQTPQRRPDLDMPCSEIEMTPP